MQKIPVIQTIKHALSAVFHFRNAGIAIGLPWMLVLAGVRAIEFFFFSSTVPAEGNLAQAMIFQPADFIIAAFSMVVFSSIAVNWHRYILLDEVTASEKIFRLDRPVWIYVFRTVLILLIVLIPVLLVSVALLSAFPNAGLLLAFPSFMAGVYFMRMSVALPAAALERKDFGIGAAMQITRGNNLQFAGLLALNALIFFVTFLALAVVLSISGSFGTIIGRIFAFALIVPANLFLSLFSVSLLSSLYGFFVEQRKF
jgi:hypothetical protein